MQTTSRRRPWEGYRYFRSQTMTGDHARRPGEDLGGALVRLGLPAGQWTGRAAGSLGLAGAVSERQLAALFGEGLHPRADEIVAEHTAAGDNAATALRAAKLGASFGHYTTSAFGKHLDQVCAAAARGAGRHLSATAKKQLREAEATRQFMQDFGRPPEDGKELARYVKAKLAPDREPVAAFAKVLAGPASFQYLWALGDEATRRTAEECHEAAVLETVAFIEARALATRSGAGGVAQHDAATGMLAVRFRHYDSRLGDPNLHEHLEIANKVQDAGGKWRTIDGRWLLAQDVAISEFFNQRLIELTCQRLGVRAAAREVTPGKRPVIEIDGVDLGLHEVFGRRSADITAALEALVCDYRERHGRTPDTRAQYALARQASRATRPPKKQARPLPELLAHWRAQAVAALGGTCVDQLLATARARAAAAPQDGEVDLDAAADAVVAAVSERRAVFARRHLEAQARRQVVLLTRGRPTTAGLVDQVLERAMARCVPLTVPPVHRPFAPLLRADGTSVYERRGRELFTTAQNLADEQSVVAAYRTPAIPAVSLQLFQQRAADPRHARLGAGQVALARSFAAGERVVRVAVGPAGAGKTSALRLVADAVHAAGGHLIALAPSSRAAQVLAADLRQHASTVHGFLAAQERAAHGKRINPALVMRAGDVVVIDEAGMAGNARVAAVVRHAQKVGAHVRLLGDPAQLGAVEAGGLLRFFAREEDAVHLTQLHRFTAPGEADASLLLRDGDTEAIAWYHREHRLHGGEGAHMADAVFAAWSKDLAAGHASVMLAPDAATVTALGARAQAWRAATGALGEAGPRLRDGARARTGDTLVTRHNQRTWLTLGGRDFVKNGDTWTLETLLEGGGALVRHTAHRGRVRLPAAYLAQHTELGYASTVHRAQGLTVDTAHALLAEGTGREAAYVAATRGRLANHLYLPGPGTPAENLHQILATSKAPLAAHHALAQARDDAVHLAQLAAQYTDATGRADHLRLAASARQHLGPAAEVLLAADAWPRLQRALLHAEGAGWSAGRILARTARYDRATGQFGGQGTTFEHAWEPAVLMAWRIGHYLAVSAATELPPPDLALADLTDPQLVALARCAQRAATRALSATVTATLTTVGATDPAHLQRLAHTRALTEAANLIRARITVERRLRRRRPDAAPPAPDHLGALPDWLADPAAWRDPHTPQPWRAHLDERRHILTQQLLAAGRRLAARPPSWTRPIGPPPAAGAGPVRAAWEHAAALTLAWRTLHRIPATAEGLGDAPADPATHDAYEALAAHLHRIAHATRAHHTQLARAADPVLLREDAATHLALIGKLVPRPPTHPRPGPFTALRVPEVEAPQVSALRPIQVTWQTLRARDLARTALQRALDGEELSEEWMAYLPAPDPDDETQQQLFLSLVAAIAQWRAQQLLTDEEPLGPEPDNLDLAEEWRHLTQALELYQASRIRDRLAQLRARRTQDLDRLAAVAAQERERTTKAGPTAARRKRAGRKRRGGGRGH